MEPPKAIPIKTLPVRRAIVAKIAARDCRNVAIP
jgi:hypothetical protein